MRDVQLSWLASISSALIRAWNLRLVERTRSVPLRITGNNVFVPHLWSEIPLWDAERRNDRVKLEAIAPRDKPATETLACKRVEMIKTVLRMNAAYEERAERCATAMLRARTD